MNDSGTPSPRLIGFESRTARAATNFGAAHWCVSRFAYVDTRDTAGLYTEILWLDEAAQAGADALRSGDPTRLGAR